MSLESVIQKLVSVLLITVVVAAVVVVVTATGEAVAVAAVVVVAAPVADPVLSLPRCAWHQSSNEQ